MTNYEDWQELTIDGKIELLTELDANYAEGNPLVEDSVYDVIYAHAKAEMPHHIYFTGVGSEVRGEKIALPYQMGSLNQVPIGGIDDEINSLGVSEEYVITDKLDGQSGMVVYDSKGNLQIAYSRGDGYRGADITRHVTNIAPKTNVPNDVVRGEIIISVEDFEELRHMVMASNGKPYKNPRNMVAGLMNSKTVDPLVYQYISFVAYDVVNRKIESDKRVQLDELQKNGFEVAPYQIFKGSELSDDMLAEFLTERKKQSGFELDGIVIDINSAASRKRIDGGKNPLNPLYSFKYKVTDASNIAHATVKKVEWNVSKHGYLKPKIEIEPVDLVGVTIRNCTGFNARFIYDNKIGPGAVIQITRSGDVIPFCQKVLTPASEPHMPDIEWTWSTTGEGVDAVTTDFTDTTIIKKQLVDFFSTINAPHLKLGNVQKLVDYGYGSAEEIILADQRVLMGILGTNGNKVYEGIRKVLSDISLYKLLGAHSQERGIGVRKFKALQTALGKDAIMNLPMVKSIADVPGFNTKTAEAAHAAIIAFYPFYAAIKDLVTLADDSVASGPLSGESVVFTGFRDKELAEEAESNGATMQSAVSGKTTILVSANPESNSGKMKKARDLGVKVMGIDEFRALIA